MALTENAKAAMADLLNLKLFTAGQAGHQKEALAAMDPEAYAQLHGIRFAAYKGSVQKTKEFKDKCDIVINHIETILAERRGDPTQEPVFTATSPEEEALYAKTDFLTQPYGDPRASEMQSPFRLTFGPPKTQTGFYVLTSDGLYYDSQSGGLDPVFTYIDYTDTIDPGNEYMFEHAPNLGGRGESFSLADSHKLIGQLFDEKKIDDGAGMTRYYNKDTFLRTLQGQRNKNITDVSSLITSSIYIGESSAVAFNLKNELEGIVGRWGALINKRKKQIEIAVKAPLLYGRHKLSEPFPDPPEGEVLIFIFKEAVDSGRGPNFESFDYYSGPYHAMPGDVLHTGAEHTKNSKEIIPFFAGGQIDAAGGSYGGPGDTVDSGDDYGGGEEGDPNADTGPRTFTRVDFQTLPVLSFDSSSMPVNDFSWISDLNFSVEIAKQKKLLFKKGDVEGVVLPYDAKFTTIRPRTDAQRISHLYATPVGKGGIIYNTSSQAHLLSLTDNIVTDGLFAIYNFLESETLKPVAWHNFNCLNSMSPDNKGNAALLSLSPSSVFNQGLAIPYLEGIAKLSTTNIGHISSMGSFVQLPPEDSYNMPPEDPSKNDPTDFVDWTYSSSGFSFECWTRVPNLTRAQGWNPGAASSLTKCLLACENTGVASAASAYYKDFDLDSLPNTRNGDVTRGFVIGFTRDRRITQDGANHSDLMSGNGIGNMSFFVAPTVSRDNAACSWVNKTSTTAALAYNYHKCKFKASVAGPAGKKFSSAMNEFVHIVVSVDPPNDTVTLYLDGDAMTTSSVVDTFGTEQFRPVNLPSFRQGNSFEYRPNSTEFNLLDAGLNTAHVGLTDTENGIIGPSELKAGPRLTRFTPFIVGGGYTDGASFIGNFMGGDPVGGKTSGLNGYIGSLKLYKKPLNTSEVNKNYEAQKGFFKSIIIDA